MNRDEITELLELTMKIAEETSLHVSFELTAMGEGSCLYIYEINRATGQIEKKFSQYFYYDRPVDGESNLAKAKEYLAGLLKEHGRCVV